MKNIFRFALTIAACSILFSCSEEKEPVVDGATFEMESYDDFWWEEFDPQPVKFVINADFKECDNHRGTLVLALCDGEQNSEIVPTDLAQVYVGGEVAEGNKIRIPASADGEVKTEVEIRINKAKLSDDVTYRWHIKLCDDAGLKKVFSKDSNGAIKEAKEGQPWVLGMDICVKNTHVANSLKQSVIWGTILFVAFVIFWYFVSRFVFWSSPSFKKVMIDYNDGYGMIDIKTSGCYEIVFTADPKKKDSLLKRLFMGHREFIVSDFWAQRDVIIKSGKKKNLVDVQARTYDISGDKIRNNPFTIINENGDKVKIETT